jgi:ATP-binding cassette, subfamily B, bacterial
MVTKKVFSHIKETYSNLKLVHRFFRIIWETDKSKVFVCSLIRIIISLIPLGMLYIGKKIIDGIVDREDAKTIIIFILIEFLLAVFSNILVKLSSYLSKILNQEFDLLISHKLILHSSKFDLEQFERSDFYDKLVRAREETGDSSGLVDEIFDQFEDIFSVIFYSAAIFVYNPWIILFFLIGVVPIFISESYFNYLSYKLNRKWTQEKRKVQYFKNLVTTDNNAKEIKVFNLTDYLLSIFLQKGKDYNNERKKLEFKKLLNNSLLYVLNIICYYLVYLYFAILAVNGTITIGSLVYLSGIVKNLEGSISRIFSSFTWMGYKSLHLKDFFDFFDLKPKMNNSLKAIVPKLPIKDGFFFDNVSFKYEGKDDWAIIDLTITVKPNEKVLILGQNGAGKTTLIKLLTRLYEPTHGEIYLDGINIKDYDISAYHSLFGAIFQDYIRFEMKAYENIGISKINDITNLNTIISSAKMGGADKFIGKLPNSYNQHLGSRFDNGTKLSGGEWQKIALSRVFFSQRSVYILDEPTASLDIQSENELFQQLLNESSKNMTIIISHRFSHIKKIDRILTLKDGKIEEDGSHYDLLDKKGEYYKLFKMRMEVI